MKMRAAMLAVCLLLGVSLAAGESRKMLEDSSSLDALLKANDFQKIGKDVPAQTPSLSTVSSPPPPPPTYLSPQPPPPPTSSPPPPTPVYYSAPPTTDKYDKCPITDLDSYYEIEGCQCDCVVSWGPKMLAPTPAPSMALPPLEPKTKIDLIQKLEDDFGIMATGRRLQSLVWDIKKNTTDDFHAVWPANMNLQGCTEPVPEVINHFQQCKCKCPSSQAPPPTWSSPPAPPTWTPAPPAWTPTPQTWTPAPQTWSASPPPPNTWTPSPTWTPAPTTWTASPPTPNTWTPSPSWTPNAQPPKQETWTPQPEHDKPWETKPPAQWNSQPEHDKPWESKPSTDGTSQPDDQPSWTSQPIKNNP